MSDNEDINRRQLLSLAGIALGATSGIGTATGQATGSTPDPDDISRRELDGEAKRRAVKRAVEDFEGSKLASRAADYDYELLADEATAVEVAVEGEFTATNVRVPVAKDGRRLSRVVDPSSLAAPETGDAARASYQWSDHDYWNSRILRTGRAGDLLDDHRMQSASVDSDVPATELLMADRDTVTVHAASARSTDAETGQPKLSEVEKVTEVVVDRDAGTMTTTEYTVDDFDQNGFCPTTWAGILFAVGSCAALCTECSGYFWSIVGLIICLGCAGCSCGLACCVGRHGGPTVCSVAWDIWTSPALVPPNILAAAGCVVLGCSGFFC